jgi:hypothetical protein
VNVSHAYREANLCVDVLANMRCEQGIDMIVNEQCLFHFSFLFFADQVEICTSFDEDLQASRLHFFDEEIYSSTDKELKNLNLPKLTRAYMVQLQCWFSCFMLKLFSNLTSLSIETSVFSAYYFVNKVSFIINMMHAMLPQCMIV